MFLMDMYFVGLSNNVNLISGVGLGNMIINLVGIQTVIGLNGALETLVPQYYGSIQNCKTKEEKDAQLHMCGILLQRGRLLILATLLPILILFFQMKEILILLKQDSVVAGYAEQYLLAAFTKLAFFGFFDCQRRWLNGFGKNHIPMICSAFAVPFHYLWCYIFVVDYDLKLTGIGIAGAFSFILQNILIIIYTCTSKDLQFTASIFDKRIYKKDEFKLFLSLAIPSVIIFWINWWIWEVITLIAGVISVNDQATHVILMSVYSFFMMLAHGFNQSTCSLVGKKIGSQNVEGAKLQSYVSYLLTSGMFFFVSIYMHLRL